MASKLIKGMVIGTVVGATIGMMNSNGMHNQKKKMMKKGKQLMKKMF